jgi:hypothetical protein
MKKTLQRFGIVTVGLSLCLWSCKEQDKNVQPSEEITVLTPTEYNSRLEDVAKALAISMNEKSVRSFIKEEALKRFDGDYDILYGQVENKKINGENFESILATNTSAGKNAKVDAVNNLRLTQKLIPLLNIAVPVNIDKWDVDNYNPLVVVLSDDYDDQKTTKVKGFRGDGSYTFIDAKLRPKDPVIVVGTNERTLFENGVYSLRQDIILMNHEEGKNSDKQIPTKSKNKNSRVSSYSNSYLYLERMFSYDISQYEGWPNGWPEIQMRVFGAFFGATSLTQFRDTGEMYLPSAGSGSYWWTNPMNTSVVYWDSSTTRDLLKFWFNEVDGGFLKEINISLGFPPVVGTSGGSSLGFKFNTGSDDDLIGEYTIDKNAGSPYTFYGYQCYDINPNFYFSLRN